MLSKTRRAERPPGFLSSDGAAGPFERYVNDFRPPARALGPQVSSHTASLNLPASRQDLSVDYVLSGQEGKSPGTLLQFAIAQRRWTLPVCPLTPDHAAPACPGFCPYCLSERSPSEADHVLGSTPNMKSWRLLHDIDFLARPLNPLHHPYMVLPMICAACLTCEVSRTRVNQPSKVASTAVPQLFRMFIWRRVNRRDRWEVDRSAFTG